MKAKLEMQNFINEQRVEPQKRDGVARIEDFKEIYELFSTNEASIQSSRCMQCGDPFCHSRCPLHNYIPYWLKSTTGLKSELAFNLSNETNPFPEITGRVCPQDRLCEGDCNLNDGHGAVTIGAIETFISEEGFKNGLKPEFAPLNSDKKVAIIGSGPAGISCATYLLRAGIEVDMYEKEARAGGLLTYGIPAFKLEKNIVERRINWLIEAGMRLHVNTQVGKDISFDEVKKSSDAIFLGLGAEEAKKPNLKNESAKNVFMSMEFLKAIQKNQFEEESEVKIDLTNKKVMVIGGGDTAMDCIRTSLRSGAEKVNCFYRRDKKSMPVGKKELKNSKEEGANFSYNVTPKKIIVNQNNEVISVEMQRTILKDNKLEIVENSEFKREVDILIFALGFSLKIPNFLDDIKLDRWGNIEVDENYESSMSGVYAGGDCKRGSDLVVTAALEGKKSAEAITKSLLR